MLISNHLRKISKSTSSLRRLRIQPILMMLLIMSLIAFSVSASASPKLREDSSISPIIIIIAIVVIVIVLIVMALILCLLCCFAVIIFAVVATVGILVFLLWKGRIRIPLLERFKLYQMIANHGKGFSSQNARTVPYNAPNPSGNGSNNNGGDDNDNNEKGASEEKGN